MQFTDVQCSWNRAITISVAVKLVAEKETECGAHVSPRSRAVSYVLSS